MFPLLVTLEWIPIVVCDLNRFCGAVLENMQVSNLDHIFLLVDHFLCMSPDSGTFTLHYFRRLKTFENGKAGKLSYVW